MAEGETPLDHRLDALSGVRVLCVGDLVLDQYVYGATQKVSREAPVPILDESRRESMLGAIGNVARNIKALGGEPILISVIGSDAEGQILPRLLESEGVVDADLLAVHDRATPIKTRFVCNGQQMFCVDRDPKQTLVRDTESAVIDAIRDAAKECDVAILADYGRGMITPGLSQAMISACRAEGVRVLVDPRRRGYGHFDGAYLIKPNAEELADEARRPTESDEEVEEALNVVMAGVPEVENLLVTRSALGMTLRTQDGEIFHHRSRPRDVFDISGAGDTTIAALALSLGAGASLKDSIDLADRAAGVVIGKVGAATARPDEILADAAGRPPRSPVNKLLAREYAIDIAARWRVRGFRVGFTYGHFDILHPGHVAHLRQARALCDRLIVGINDDASVRRLKGPGRPVNDAASRAEVVGGLDCVDRIVILDEDSPINLIRELKPDVVVRGGGSSLNPLGAFGADVVRGYGGEVKSARRSPGYSTDAALAKMSRSEG